MAIVKFSNYQRTERALGEKASIAFRGYPFVDPYANIRSKGKLNQWQFVNFFFSNRVLGSQLLEATMF